MADVLLYGAGILAGNEAAVPIGNAPCADNFPSSSTQWVEILVNEMTNASNMDDAKARASRVLEVFEKSMTAHVGAMGSFQKVIQIPSKSASELSGLLASYLTFDVVMILSCSFILVHSRLPRYRCSYWVT